MILAFAALGFLIGNMVGLTAESVISALLPLLFAFGGGSAVGLLHKLDADGRKAASGAILSLSIACLVGTYIGITVSEYQLLTPPERRQLRADASISESKYLRSFLASEASRIDQLKATGILTAEQAYEAQYQLLIQAE